MVTRDVQAEWARQAAEVLPNGMPRYVMNFQHPDDQGRIVNEWVESPWAAYFD